MISFKEVNIQKCQTKKNKTIYLMIDSNREVQKSETLQTFLLAS